MSRRTHSKSEPAKRAPALRRRRRVSWWLGAGILTMALAGGAGFFLSRPTPVRHVILISVDTLRADHLSCYGYRRLETPHIDRLARDGVLFENAATVTPLTLPAHASMLTGRTPLHHGVIDNFGFVLEAGEETLAELLQEAGFATGGFVGSFVLDARTGIGQGFDTYFDRFEAPLGRRTSLESSQRPGDQVLAPALEWIGRRRDAPFFAFIHFFDPHTPYAPPEPYRNPSRNGTVALYDGEIAFVDDLVGELIAKLEEWELYEDALILVVGDHGEALGDHGESTHGFFVYDETIRVPLIVNSPGARAAGRVAAQVRTIDILPTILDMAGSESPPFVEGVSLRPFLETPKADLGLLAYIESHYTRLHFGLAPLRGVRNAHYKFIEAPRPELYDLKADPEETKNLFPQTPGEAKGLLSAFQRLIEGEGTRELAPATVDADTEQRLRALGYITTVDEPGVSSQQWRNLPDPKDRIELFNQLTSARVAIAAGETERARTSLRDLLDRDPEVITAYLMLGEALLQERQFDQAVGAFREALQRNRRSPQARYGLAVAHIGLGELEEAARELDECLALDPRDERAAGELAEVRLQQGRPAEAERLARDILTDRPSSSMRLLLAEALEDQGQTAEALSVLEQARSADPANALLHLNLGNLLLEAGRLEEAVSSYRRATDLAPGDARTQNALGNALARKGDKGEALAAFQEAVELDPSFAPAQNNLGITLASLGRPADARSAFQQAIRSDPHYAEAYNNLGYLYLTAGNSEEAVSLFRRALELKPDYAQAKANLDLARKSLKEKRR